MHSRQRSLGQFLARYLAIYAAIAIPLLLVIGLQLKTESDTAVAYAKTNARKVASTLEAKIEAELKAAVTTVTRISEGVDQATLNAAAAPKNRAAINRWLQSFVPFLSTATAIRLFQADGTLLYSSSDSDVNSSLNISDRLFFQHAKTELSNAPIFSEVVIGRLTKRVTMYVVKAIRDQEGTFLGLSMAAIDLNALHAFFKEIGIGPEGVLGLRRLDNGATVVRYPGPVEVDNAPSPNLPTRVGLLQNGKESVIEVLSPVDKVFRIYASRQVGTYPLYVVVGVAEEDYLADWYQHRRSLLMATFALLAILGLVLYLLAVTQRKRELSELALQESHEQLESQVRERTTELTEALSRFNGFMNIVPSAIAIIDFDGTAKYFNPGFEELLGYTIHDSPNMEAWWVNAYPDPEYRQEIRQAWENALQVSSTNGLPIKDFEARVCTKSGNDIWVSAYAHVSEMTIYIAMVDTTTRRLQQEKIASLNESLEKRAIEAEAANRAKSAFLANMSHEIRTPMNGVLGMIELARRHMSDPQGRDKLDKAQGAAERLLGVLNDILDLSKIEAERLVLETAPLQLGRVIDTLVSTIGHKATEKGLSLEIDVSATLASRPLQGDALRLGQVLLNLVGNAIKFTERGRVLLRVTEAGETPETMLVRFEVMDTGIGIPPDAQARLFQSFEQADNSMTRKYGGTGLGLAICKRLVHLMGGSEIGIQSESGGGSSFWFVVPLGKLDQSTAPPEPAFEAGEAELRLQAEFAGTHLLLAEDEPLTQEVSRGLLEDVGLVVDVAEDGQQALELARTSRYALILMDMQMPNLNGVDATKAIRENSLNMDTPIVAMTANAFEEDRQCCLDVGMSDHIAKPVIPKLLYATLLKWLDKA